MRLFLKRFVMIVIACIAVYGGGRLYYFLTGGFLVSNITSDFAYQPQWEVRPLNKNEKEEFANAIDQPFYYLGKGCQSYVFQSEDGKYVIKFFKYQRYRLRSWLNYSPPLPAIVKFRQEKIEKKWKKLDGFVKSWKIAFENLKDESGLIYVHLNKTNNLNKDLIIFDKIGQRHLVSLDQMEFCIQKKASMLCDTLLEYKEKGDITQAKQLIHSLLTMILGEYSRGLADNDHALMQNTGVALGQPVHIDVGQFVINEEIKQPSVFYQELFTKTYKFKNWLKEQYPELALYLDQELRQIMGPSYTSMQPKWRKKN